MLLYDTCIDGYKIILTVYWSLQYNLWTIVLQLFF